MHCAVSGKSRLAGKYLKPYQGLKHVYSNRSCSGAWAGKYLKPYQGLKLQNPINSRCPWRAGKYLKPYQGLKQAVISATTFKSWLSRKIPKTLSGIETNDVRAVFNQEKCAGKYLKPYQGLKPMEIAARTRYPAAWAGKYLKPYQGLKRCSCLQCRWC